MNADFRDILELLLEAHAEFVVVGAHAMAVHGAARATGDIDLWVRPTGVDLHVDLEPDALARPVRPPPS